MTRSLRIIAQEIYTEWPKMQEVSVKPSPFGLVEVQHPARPYLMAMMHLDATCDNYGADSGLHIVLYFLSNAAGWRGEKAKAIKAELRALIK